MKKIWSVLPMLIISVLCLAVFTVIAFFSSPYVFVFELCVTLAVIFFSITNYLRIHLAVFKYIKIVTKTLGDTDNTVMEKYPMPLMLVSDKEEILWYNTSFEQNVISGENCIGFKAKKIFGDYDCDTITSSKGVNVDYKEKHFTVSGIEVKKGSTKYSVIFFVDDTYYKNIAKTYQLTKPSVLYLVFDNYDEMTNNTKENERGAILGAVESIIDEYITGTKGFYVKISRDRFMLMLEEENLQSLIESKFPLLDKAREIKRGQSYNATLSIGVGQGSSSLKESEQTARQALDMALGRGGDQAAVKNINGYSFYGGLSKGVEKRTKVRSRIIAKALTDLIKASDNVFIMGHRFGDLDSMGSSIALYSVAKALQKPAYIVVDEEKNLSIPLVERYEESGMFLDPRDAQQFVTRKSMIIIVDTHNPEFLESKELYTHIKTVVVIDHHRKMVNYIDNAVIFFHETYASSSCEMVTELLEYIEDVEIGKLEAEALLSGIMMDTKNFVMKTGVRTFEAAAFLKRKGADTVAVKRLFSGTMDSYVQKTQLVANAQFYKNYAVAYVDEAFENIRVVASQAADELLTISGVDASFVMYFDNDEVTISARSLGNVNVQVIMEQLGGGGHQTMAGAQLKDVTIEQANLKLIEVLDKDEA